MNSARSIRCKFAALAAEVFARSVWAVHQSSRFHAESAPSEGGKTSGVPSAATMIAASSASISAVLIPAPPWSGTICEYGAAVSG